ncbi:MAG: glycosyltransferase [Actinomycetota bacterium]
MRICLVARNRFHNDRKAIVKFRVLERAGHDVEVVAVDNRPPRSPVSSTVRSQAGPASWLGSIVNRLLPSAVHTFVLRKQLVDAAAALDADLYLPLQEEMLEVAIGAARKTGRAVQRSPQMDGANEVDAIWLAPARPEVASPVPGLGPTFVPGYDPEPYVPEPGRHSGGRAVICYRKTQANPGRYLESALLRSGLEVRVETDNIDLGTVDAATRFVIFVESPYPPIEVSGSTRVPVLFWAHHGEHHLFPNVRLTDRYSADAVLLAHSWHLAHWFPAPVHRFPFAIAPELSPPIKRLADRRYDVAMVGSKLRGDAWQYRRRRQLIQDLESQLNEDRVCFAEGVTPAEMAAIYGDSRVVLNEGGVRHFPITMRVFEAVGSGAALLTDPVPGLDMLFEPTQEYALLTSNVVESVERLVGDLDTTQGMVDRARVRAMGHHTYDHRVDQLMSIAADLSKREVMQTAPHTDLARLIDRDVEVQRIVHVDADDLTEQLPDREIWPISEREGRLVPGSMDAAVVTEGDAKKMTVPLDAARRYIYTSDRVSGLEEYVAENRPSATIEAHGAHRRIDLKAESYRIDPAAGNDR